MHRTVFAVPGCFRQAAAQRWHAATASLQGSMQELKSSSCISASNQHNKVGAAASLIGLRRALRRSRNRRLRIVERDDEQISGCSI
jgi:hypothetical protein